MSLIKVDNEKCISCGLCVNVCAAGVIKMDENYPEAIETISEYCTGCGHCVAVCPNGAMDNIKAPLENQIPIEKEHTLDGNIVANFMRSRRSVRNYKEKTIPREKILELLDVARYAPTGNNSQGVSYLVIDDKDTLKELSKSVVDWAEEESKKDSPISSALVNQVQHYYKTGEDFVLRGAPCVIVTMMDKAFPDRVNENGRFSLAYAQLYAPSIGLGSCWSGIIEYCLFIGYKPLMDLLKLPENMKVTGSITIGYPQFTYNRIVGRNPLNVSWK